MTYFLIGGVVLLAGFAAFQQLRRASRGQLMRLLRWGVGGLALLVAGLFLLARRFDIALFAGAAALSVIRFGRLGPFSLDGGQSHEGNTSRVKSRYFAMTLDHDTGAVEGRVIAGEFAGADLMDLGEMDTRLLIAEIEGDPDSTSLLESWLDANRSGWREYFAGASTAEEETVSEAPPDPDAEAYEILGLKPGASHDEIRAAHRELMKGVHPDHGGSSYLASKINAARDRLLKS
ncbi:MAG TPA: DnaJ domain-containing protein [Devosia sp.]|jgi:hypothetical protein|nr:DnaJ domain-containing protein [Devosia sp.]